MSEYIDIAEANPITFVKKITEAINNGYSVHNTIGGYPQLNRYGSIVRLFKTPTAASQSVTEASREIFTEDIMKIEHYDPMGFLLLVQQAVDSGYEFVDSGPHFFDEIGLKSVTFKKAEKKESKQEDVKKPVAKRQTKSTEKGE